MSLVGRFEIREVAPIGHVLPACPMACLFGPPLPRYPESLDGKDLRDIRLARGLSLREAAQIVGLPVERFGGLERGRYTLSEEQWEALLVGVACFEKRTV